MKRPGWAIIIGIVMLLFGGCGACNRATEIMLPSINEIVEESILEAKENQDNELDPEKAARRDSIKAHNTTKLEDLSEEDRKVLDFLSDTIMVDENNNVDMEATILGMAHVSDYRQTWVTRFAYIGIFIAILFIIGGIMLLRFKKYTIPLVITGLALSMAANIAQIVIYSMDKESGSIFGSLGSIGFYVSIAFDILLLILVMVLDKTFFRPKVIQEDYYD